MERDDIVEKVEHPLYAVWRARDGSVTIKLEGHVSEFSHDIRDSERLRVLSTELVSLPHDIRQFREIKYLQMGNMRDDDDDDSLLELDREIVEEMTQLEELKVLYKRAISDIPQRICARLTLLRKLVISRCGPTSLPHNTGQLTILMLQLLDLSWNKLQHLCDSFSSLINLKYLDLFRNPFVALHKELSLLPSQVSYMTEMKLLDISENYVSHLPKQLCDLHKLSVVHASSNPLVSPSVEVCNRGMSVIRTYFHSLPLWQSNGKGMLTD